MCRPTATKAVGNLLSHRLPPMTTPPGGLTLALVCLTAVPVRQTTAAAACQLLELWPLQLPPGSDPAAVSEPRRRQQEISSSSIICRSRPNRTAQASRHHGRTALRSHHHIARQHQAVATEPHVPVKASAAVREHVAVTAWVPVGVLAAAMPPHRAAPHLALQPPHQHLEAATRAG